MYQIFMHKQGTRRKPATKQLFLAMKLTTILLFFSFMQVSAVTLAQRVSLSEKNTPVAKVFKKITVQTGYAFFVSGSTLKNTRPVTIAVKDAGLEQVLSAIFDGQPLDFIIKDQMVIVSLKATPNGVSRLPKDGRISGKIIDEKGQTLPGATIRVVETGAGIQSSSEGSYVLALPPGTYTVEISFISYQPQRITDIVVTEDKTTLLDVAMKPAVSSLKEVVVVSNYKKASVEGLYARQKNNTAITDGITSEQIANTPDKNLGESLKRISGVAVMDNKYLVVRGLSERYNSAMLNGQQLPSTELNRKQFAFDIIPANLVDNITVYKTITPDQSAEFGGGLVQVNTKEIPTGNFFSVSLGSSVNDKTYHKNFRALAIGNTEYFGGIPDDRRIANRLDWKSRADILSAGIFNYNGDVKENLKLTDPANIPNNWGLHNYRPDLSPNGQLSFGRVINLPHNRQLGVIASASYRNTWQTQDVLSGRDGFIPNTEDDPGHRLFSGKRYGFTNNLGGLAGLAYSTYKTKLSYQALYLRTLDQQDVIGTGQKEDFGAAVGIYDNFMQTTMLQQQLKGEQRLGDRGLRVNYGLSYLTLDKQRPDNHFLFADYKGTGEDDPNLNSDFSIGPQITGPLLIGPSRVWSRAYEKDLNWNADLTLPFDLKAGGIAIRNTFKGGYAGWRKDRSFFVFNTYNVPVGADNYPLSNAFDPTHSTLQGSFYGDDYPGPGKSGVAVLHAGYLMMDNKAGKFRLTWGGRAEYYNLNKVNAVLQNLVDLANVNQPADKQQDFSAVLNREKNWKFFPSAGLTYNLTPSMNLRASYARSIIRPDLRELAVFQEYDYELGGTYRSDAPLHSTIINHIDLRYEWYPSAGEVVSFSAFYKKLDYPMEIYKISGNREYALRNNKDAKNRGLEVDFRKSLAFTGIPVIRNITLFGNGTLLDSRVRSMTFSTKADSLNPLKIRVNETVGAEEKRPQTGASNYTLNAGAAYDSRLVSLNLSYNYVSNRTFLPNVVYQETLFERPAKSLDGQLAFHLLDRKLELKLNVSNLLDSYSITYYNLVGADANEPVKVSDLLYKKGTSLINYLLKPGRTYSTSLTYNF